MSAALPPDRMRQKFKTSPYTLPSGSSNSFIAPKMRDARPAHLVDAVLHDLLGDILRDKRRDTLSAILSDILISEFFETSNNFSLRQTNAKTFGVGRNKCLNGYEVRDLGNLD